MEKIIKALSKDTIASAKASYKAKRLTKSEYKEFKSGIKCLKKEMRELPVSIAIILEATHLALEYDFNKEV